LHIRAHAYMRAHACTYTWVRTRAQDTTRHAEAPPPGPFICAYVCTCMRMHTRAHERVHGRTHICMYTYICMPAHIYAYTSTLTRMWMYACTHASTPGTTAPQQQGEELMQTQEASHISPVQRNQPHLASPMLQQSPSRQARRSPSPICRMWLSRATRGQ